MIFKILLCTSLLLFLIKNYCVIIERTRSLVKFQGNGTERLIVDNENWTIMRKATSVLAASSRLDDQTAGNKVCPA